ncbi:hypothetical protein B0H10DRAFT_1943287 [Mycena sp. CBHHK59/15]|nr:hypothetical protein B0H10DRAFT_1943287 [Mycena sp. CBHHK59/15]
MPTETTLKGIVNTFKLYYGETSGLWGMCSILQLNWFGAVILELGPARCLVQMEMVRTRESREGSLLEARILPYSDLLRTLDMPTVCKLEDLIIDAIYLEILRSCLNQKQEQLEVEYTMGRDPAPGAIDAVLAVLWDCLKSNNDKMSRHVAAQTTARRADLAVHHTALQNALHEATKDKGSHAHRDCRGGLGMALGGSSMYGGNIDSVMMIDGYHEGRILSGRAAKLHQTRASLIRGHEVHAPCPYVRTS